MVEINKIYEEDCRITLDRMEGNSIDCVVTSPPYWALRDYGEEAVSIWDNVNGCVHDFSIIAEPRRNRNENDIKDKNSKEATKSASAYNSKNTAFCKKCNAWRGALGLEPTFNLYIKHLCDIFDGVKGVLKKEGSVWVNIGDTYGGSGCGTNDYRTEKSRSIQGKGKNRELYKTGGIAQKLDYPAKSLCLIPFRFAIEMVNRGWILRNTIIWYKRNCMPASVKDRFTVDFEYLFFFAKSRKYYFKQQFDEYIKPMDRWGGEKLKAKGNSNWDKGTGQSFYRNRNMRPNKIGRNKRCVWNIPVSSSSDNETNFAVYPEKLIETPIKAGCPEGGIVYDPFMGTGTTGKVALKLNRNFIGSEIIPQNTKIANKRINREMSILKLF